MPTFESDYKEGLDIYDQAVDRGEASLIEDGFPPATRPKDVNGEFGDCPQLPPSLSSLGMAELQDLMGKFTAWFAYALELLPDAIARRNTYENSRAFAWSKIRRSYSGTVSDKDDQTRIDSRYVEIHAEYETALYRATKLKAVADGLQREIETVSRAITGLEGRTETEGNAYGGQRRGNASRGIVHPPKKTILRHFRRGRDRR